MRADLRELLARIDGGAAFAIDQIPVKDLQHLLASLFENLLLKKTKQGLYTKPSHVGSLLLLLSPVFEETPAELATDVSQGTGNSMHTLAEAPVKPADLHQAPPVQLNNSSSHIHHASADDQEPQSGSIGPSMPPTADSEVAATSEGDPAAPNADDDAANQPTLEPRMVAIGPAAPPPELLAAAAQLPWEEDEEDVEDLIGPAPPEMAEELDGVGGDERVAEVARVIRLLSNLPAGQEADAYDVLGVEPSATSGEIKKRYWRLSLLIHPDKCAHPRANDAFQAVSKMSKELQDVSKRKAIDDAREDARLFKIASELADDEERKRQWRVARGEATAEDLAGPVRRGPQPRDSWMTDLPPERVPTTLAPQGNQNTQGEWEGKHPWRPFDREKDLNIASKPANKDELLKKAGSLTGRFGGSTTGQRTFL
ncbi:hypothetical protein WJX82_011271 [Trebouxia sp. C0006]